MLQYVRGECVSVQTSIEPQTLNERRTPFMVTSEH